jgi:hypothetical protein
LKENPQIKGTKAMKLNFYTQTTPTYAGGERNTHFKFIDQRTQVKRMKKKYYKKRSEYLITHPLVQTLTGYIEASKCKTLEKFIEKEVKQ